MQPKLLHGTVCVPELDAALALYRDVFEQTLISRSTVGESEALAWGAPEMTGAATAVLQPPSGKPVYLRLIEQANPQGYRAGTHFGWAALELSVKDADAMYAKLQQVGTPIIAPPKPLSFTDKLYPMQARGPGGEAIYLNEVRGNLPSSDLPMADCWVDELFIAVMGCRDMAATLRFYHQVLGTTTGGEWEMPYSVMNISFGLPMTTAHKLATVADARRVLFEVDQYPGISTARPADAGRLPQGVAMIGVALAAAPQGVTFVSSPAPRAEAPYHGRMVGVVRGLDGELTELVWAS
jgi:catechol 2,3-dioxygenase-like lactoylglutathione lyase family enzyme